MHNTFYAWVLMMADEVDLNILKGVVCEEEMWYTVRVGKVLISFFRLSSLFLLVPSVFEVAMRDCA
jgi:hypothetical protein